QLELRLLADRNPSGAQANHYHLLHHSLHVLLIRRRPLDPCFSSRARRHHRNTMAAAPSYCDISLMITLSPGCRPLLISIRFTEVAPNCTGTFFAEWPSGSILKSITRVLG